MDHQTGNGSPVGRENIDLCVYKFQNQAILQLGLIFSIIKANSNAIPPTNWPGMCFCCQCTLLIHTFHRRSCTSQMYLPNRKASGVHFWSEPRRATCGAPSVLDCNSHDPSSLDMPTMAAVIWYSAHLENYKCPTLGYSIGLLDQDWGDVHSNLCLATNLHGSPWVYFSVWLMAQELCEDKTQLFTLWFQILLEERWEITSIKKEISIELEKKHSM